MVRKKSEIAKSMKIGGAMIWALDLDDFRNKCGCETYPLLKTINRVLRNYPESSAKCVVKCKNFTNSFQLSYPNWCWNIYQLFKEFSQRLLWLRPLVKRILTDHTNPIAQVITTAFLDNGVPTPVRMACSGTRYGDLTLDRKCLYTFCFISGILRLAIQHAMRRR